MKPNNNNSTIGEEKSIAVFIERLRCLILATTDERLRFIRLFLLALAEAEANRIKSAH